MINTIKLIACTVLFLLTVITGCSSPEMVPVDTSNPTVIQPTSIKIKSVTPPAAPTSLVVPATLTPNLAFESSPTTVPTETIENIPVCSGEGIPISPSDGFDFPGTLVLKYRDRQELLTLGGNPLKQSHLSLPEAHEIQTLSYSPDEEWMAYVPVTRESNFAKIPTINKTMIISGTEIVLETPSIILLSSNGERIEQDFGIESIKGDLVEGDYLQRIVAVSWINDHLLHVVFHTNNFDPYSNGHYLDEIFDPFEGIWLKEPFDEIEDRLPDGKVAFSPDMRRVLYEAGTKDHPLGIKLQDLETDELIWSDQDFYSPQQTFISWAPDSSMVAVGNWGVSPEDRRVYLISRDGEARDISNLLSPAIDFIIEGLYWSPNSRYLAIKNGFAVIDSLYLFDTTTNQYLYSCPLVSYPNAAPVLLWSPDTRYLAVSSLLPSDQFPLQIINVQTGQVVELLPDGNLEYYVEDWLDTLPLEWP